MGHAAVLLWRHPLCGRTRAPWLSRAAVRSLLCLARGPWSNIAVGVASALIDNIPIMFAVLTMSPDMSQGQWLLVTLTAGVGGSLLSIGSAAGVALMGQARGIYTFFAHLKWTWAIALGYAASIWVHFLINARKILTTGGIRKGAGVSRTCEGATNTRDDKPIAFQSTPRAIHGVLLERNAADWSSAAARRAEFTHDADGP